LLIPAPRQKLTDRSLLVETWQLAPLGLNVGSIGYMALESPSSSSTPASLDLILSIFPQSTWSDLWRIEIETFDTPGNLNLFTDILKKRRLRIEVAEGSISTFSVYHAMTFIVSAHSYTDRFDKRSHERASMPSPRLDALELDILANFSKEVSFNAARHPRIKIKRMDEYNRMHVLYNEKHLHISEFKRDPPDSKGRSRVVIPNEVWDPLHAAFGELIDYSVLVDTKSRLARVMLFARTERRYEHIQVSIPVGNGRGDALQALLSSIASSGLNVSRFQMRRGSSKMMRAYGISESEHSRLDLTIDSKTETGDAIIKMIVAALASRPVRELGVKFIRSRSFSGEAYVPDELRWK
jgi:hypothetical protein